MERYCSTAVVAYQLGYNYSTLVFKNAAN